MSGMNVDEALGRLDRYTHAVIVTRDPDGYPLSVATSFRVAGRAVELEPARAVFGVTLGEHGISRIVSVRLQHNALVPVAERTA